MLIITVCYIIGIIWGLYFNTNIALFVSAMLIIILAINVVIVKLNKNKKIGYVYSNKIVINMCIISFCISAIIVMSLESKHTVISENVTGELNYVATVVSVKNDSKYFHNYIINIQDTSCNCCCKNVKAVLKVRKDTTSTYPNLEYGDLIYGIGMFEKPEVREKLWGIQLLSIVKVKGYLPYLQLKSK